MKLGLDFEQTQRTPLHHTHTLPTLSWHLRSLRMHPPPSFAPHMLCFNRYGKLVFYKYLVEMLERLSLL